ncbi:hypothetical protein ACIODW_23550 [Streptomyces sp. NPDC087897]|uniref:hypothetical protein n=1 Tax=Streptomyces sp. NPDC087897 TaxID=3365817 RepID=UPI0038160919
MPDPRHVPQSPQEEHDMMRVWHEPGPETARQEAALADAVRDGVGERSPARRQGR